MSNSELINILSNRFEGFASPPATSVWANIEAELNEEDRKRKAIWMWRTSGIAAASLIGFIIYSLSGSSQSIESQIESIADKTEITPESDKLNEKTTKVPSQNNPQISVQEDEGKIEKNALNNLEGNPKIDSENIILRNDELLKPVRLAHVENPILSLDPLILRQLDDQIGSKLDPITFANRPEQRIPKWSAGFNVIAFANSPGQDKFNSDGTSQLIEPSPDPDPETIETSHARFIELNGYIEKQISRRFTVGAGISVSISRSHYGEIITSDGIPISSRFDRNYWAIGIPLHTDIAVIQKGRFNINAGMSIQPELRFISRMVNYESTPPPADVYATNGAFEAQSSGNFDNFHVGIQPTIGVDYFVGTKVKLSLQAGYRTYLFRNDYLRSKGVEPNYITASVGVGWLIN